MMEDVLAEHRPEAMSLGLLSARTASAAQLVLDGYPLGAHDRATLAQLRRRLQTEAALLRGETVEDLGALQLNYAFAGLTLRALKGLGEALATSSMTSDPARAQAPGDIAAQLEDVDRRIGDLLSGNPEHAGFLCNLFDAVSAQIRANSRFSGERRSVYRPTNVF